MSDAGRRPPARRRRDAGDGSIYLERASGRYVAQLDISDGGPRRFKRSYHATKAEAREALRDLRDAKTQLLAGEGPTVEDWMELWLASRHVRQLAAATRQQYEQGARTNVIPFLGAYRLRALTPALLDAWLEELAAARRRPSVVVVARNVFRAALNHAVRVDVLQVNPIEKLQLRRATRRRVRIFTPEELAAILTAAPPWLRTAVALMAILGVRRGELLGLQWEDVDFAAATVTIRRSVVAKVDRRGQAPGPGVKAPKTEAGLRTIPLPAVAAELLVGHRRRQELEAAARSRPISRWIFPSASGRFLQPRNLNRAYYTARAAAHLSKTLRLHDLRHTAATALLTVGTDENAVAAWLGHTDVRTTRGLYHHPDAKAQEFGAAALSRFWRSTVRGSGDDD